MSWTNVVIRYDGTSQVLRLDRNIDSHRTQDDAYWKTTLNLPELVVVEWVDASSQARPTFNHFLIYVKNDD